MNKGRKERGRERERRLGKGNMRWGCHSLNLFPAKFKPGNNLEACANVSGGGALVRC